ncbi:MAG TPA: transcription antitermination factor NusB [Clostridiales bacterium]|nr:transcription antitermination factor NusB [Clostridiales bacterium]HOL90879.1 transcription antitermination factor NusB [Clostridiales bacterium]HPP35213.1 transcription antitermination factor NusB [Clostridiales bacterium]
MGRRAAREMAMKLLYQMEIQKDDIESQMKLFFEHNPVSENDTSYIRDIIYGVYRNSEYISDIIQKHSRGWKITRISKIDLSILRLSIYEICFRDDIPFSVSVNEAVELAKKYSSEEAGSFINGILSRLSDSRTGAGIENGC